MKQKITSVYRTDNYDTFKLLDGNRAVADGRMKKIKKSIETVGYVCNPIIVNERMEVCDGQGRLAALRMLGLPVDYIVVEGIGISECVAMNITQSNWKLTDYIDSYAAQGKTDYQYLQLLVRNNAKMLPLETIFYASDRLKRAARNVVKDGLFMCGKEEYDNAVMLLNYVKVAKPAFEMVKGHREAYLTGSVFMFRHPDIDPTLFNEKLFKNQSMLRTVAGRREAVSVLEEVYNFRNRSKVYVMSDYAKEENGGRA